MSVLLSSKRDWRGGIAKYAHEQLPRDRTNYEAAEDRAAADRVGLWQDKNPTPPWEWLHKHR
jgi:endonuclease YncB( thermonuclease family)